MIIILSIMMTQHEKPLQDVNQAGPTTGYNRPTEGSSKAKSPATNSRARERQRGDEVKTVD